MQSDQPYGPKMLARIAFVVSLMGLCVWLLWSFIPALVWASVIAIASWPLRDRCIGLGLRSATTAALLTIALAILAIAPFALFGAEIAREGVLIAEIADQARRGHLEAPEWLARLPVLGPQAVEWWHAHLTTPAGSRQLLDQYQSGDAVRFSREIGRWILRRLVVFGFTLLALFFLYKDGPKLAADADRLGSRLFGAAAKRYGRLGVIAVRATVNGLVLVGLGEGAMLGIAYIVVGVPHPITFAIATSVLAIVPFGAPVVVVIASATLLVGSHLIVGLVLLVGGLVAVFIVDHTARPVLIGNAIRLPFFWTLLGVFGGLEAFGIVGLFIGPAILAVSLAIWRGAAEPEPMSDPA